MLFDARADALRERLELIERKFGIRLGLTAIGELLARLNLTPQNPLQCANQRDPETIERWQRVSYPAIARQARTKGGEVFFWDELGFRADAVHGRTWGVKGQTPVVARPGQRQTISAASAMNARGGFWYCTYDGGLTAELFVCLLRKMMRHRSKPVHLVVDGLPAHKTELVKDYVQTTKGRLTTAHFLRAANATTPRPLSASPSKTVKYPFIKGSPRITRPSSPGVIAARAAPTCSVSTCQ